MITLLLPYVVIVAIVLLALVFIFKYSIWSGETWFITMFSVVIFTLGKFFG
jgi:hypothetical protein